MHLKSAKLIYNKNIDTAAVKASKTIPILKVYLYSSKKESLLSTYKALTRPISGVCLHYMVIGLINYHYTHLNFTHHKSDKNHIPNTHQLHETTKNNINPLDMDRVT